MAGKVGRSGRKKVASTLVNEALERVDQRIPELFNKLVEKGLEGDRECLIYLIDRRLGKPKQSSDIEIAGGSEFGAATLVKLFQLMSDKRRELLEEERMPRLKDGESLESSSQESVTP